MSYQRVLCVPGSSGARPHSHRPTPLGVVIPGGVRQALQPSGTSRVFLCLVHSQLPVLIGSSFSQERGRARTALHLWISSQRRAYDRRCSPTAGRLSRRRAANSAAMAVDCWKRLRRVAEAERCARSWRREAVLTWAVRSHLLSPYMHIYIYIYIRYIDIHR